MPSYSVIACQTTTRHFSQIPAQLKTTNKPNQALRDEVVASIQATFPKERCPRVLELLDTYGVELYERERERVQLAILKLSDGNEEKVREFVAVAKRDYRDVLFWAEHPEEARLDTPEKRQRMRNRFEKFGIKLPEDL